ncbi:Homoserine/threonine efflux protein [Rhodospirillaceae bacterium LM-1]|nr:Homoserine/threonine efflux protein [Rhodospirillaceae bacterium LM-1]
MTLLEALPVSAPLLSGFAAVALAIVVSPGPDTLLILRHTLTSGRGTGFATVFGVQVGVAIHTLAAALGLTLLIAGSPVLFRFVALAGAAYLGWLGIQAWKSAALDFAQDAADGVLPWQGFRDAILTNLLNPKVIVLFLALMPGFVEPEKGHVGLQMVTLGLLLVVINTVWQVGLALAAGWARGHLLKPLWQKAINRASGAVFMAFAILMLVEHGLRHG